MVSVVGQAAAEAHVHGGRQETASGGVQTADEVAPPGSTPAVVRRTADLHHLLIQPVRAALAVRQR